MSAATRSNGARSKRVEPSPCATPLLEPVDGIILPGRTVRGWKFTRRPNWWMYTDIEPGTLLVNEPGTRGAEPWSLVFPSGHVRPLSDTLAVELLFISSAERYAAWSVQVGESEGANYSVRRAGEYAIRAIEGKV